MSNIKNFLHTSHFRGVTTTHPWCSVFMRFIYFIVSLVKLAQKPVKSMVEKFSKMKNNLKLNKLAALVFCSIFVISSTCNDVSAAAQLIPEIEPVYETTIESLYEFVKVQLNDTNKQVFDLLLGSYMVGYAGLADYRLSYVYNEEAPLKEWLINSGADLYNTILSLGGIPQETQSIPVAGTSVPLIGYTQLTPLIQVAMGCAIKSKEYSSVNDALSDINSSEKYPIPLNVDIMSSLNAAMGYYGGLYEWQFQPLNYSSTFEWVQYSLSGTMKSSYENAVSSLSTPRHLMSNYQSNIWRKNAIMGSNPTGDSFDLFINTSNNTAYFYNAVNNSGIPAVNVGYGNSISKPNGSLYFGTFGYNPNNYDSYYEIAQAALNESGPGSNYGGLVVFFMDGISFSVDPMSFLNKVYYGSSWANRQEVNALSGKDLEKPAAPTYLQGVLDGLLDLKGLLQDLLNVNELKQPVINNYYYPDSEPVSESDMKEKSDGPDIPTSGVVIPTGLFAPFTKYITYLWNNTKPLIKYTSDLIKCLTFDGSGMAWVFYGSVSCGLIGGILCKFLL